MKHSTEILETGQTAISNKKLTIIDAEPQREDREIIEEQNMMS